MIGVDASGKASEGMTVVVGRIEPREPAVEGMFPITKLLEEDADG